MTSKMIEQFTRVFELPARLLPYLNLVADADEIRLNVTLGHQEATAAEVAMLMGMRRDDAEALLGRASYRHTIDWRSTPDGQKLFTAGNAWNRVTYLSMQEDADKWVAIPQEDHNAIVEWHFWENIRHHGLVERTDRLKEDIDSAFIMNRDFLLLDEALALIDAATLHVVVPCDCRTTHMACDHSRWETCFRLDDRARATLARGDGRIVTKEEMRRITIDADREGLMHTGQRAEHGRPAILNGNCCACCSYPVREGIALGMDKQWPKPHYLSERDLSLCDDCGICAKRCYFSAYYLDEAGRIQFNAELCHGCGLCATGCPQHATKMIPLD